MRYVLVVTLALVLCAMTGSASADPYLVNVQDDGAALWSTDQQRERSLDRAMELGATSFRFIVDATQVRQRGWSRHLALLESLKRRQLVPVMALTGVDLVWDPTAFGRWTEKAVRSLGAPVGIYGVFNEPNTRWLRPGNDGTRALRYRRLYQAAEPRIRQAAPGALVAFGEVSSISLPSRTVKGERTTDPIAFLEEALCMNDNREPMHEVCAPIVADLVSVHAYQFDVPPSEKPEAGTLGIGAIDRLVRLVDDACAAGLLETPSGECPDIAITEFGYLSYSRGHLSDDNQPPEVRSNWLPEAFDVACRTAGVRMMSQYQLHRSPPPKVWPGRWDSSVLNRYGYPSSAFDSLAFWLDDHPECRLKRASSEQRLAVLRPEF